METAKILVAVLVRSDFPKKTKRKLRCHIIGIEFSSLAILGSSHLPRRLKTEKRHIYGRAVHIVLTF